MQISEGTICTSSAALCLLRGYKFIAEGALSGPYIYRGSGLSGKQLNGEIKGENGRSCVAAHLCFNAGNCLPKAFTQEEGFHSHHLAAQGLWMFCFFGGWRLTVISFEELFLEISV